MRLLAVRLWKKAPTLRVSAVVFETTLPYQVCPALEIQGEVWAHFPAAPPGLRQTSCRDPRAAAEKWESQPMVVYRKMPIQNVLVIHMKANQSFPVLETLLFSDQEMQLFGDQGMDMVFAKHCWVLVAEFADDRRDMEEKELDSDRIQKCRQCFDWHSRG